MGGMHYLELLLTRPQLAHLEGALENTWLKLEPISLTVYVVNIHPGVVLIFSVSMSVFLANLCLHTVYHVE